MVMTAGDIIRQLYDAYAKRDIDSALSHCRDDIDFYWIAEPDNTRYAGYCKGKQAFLDRLLSLDKDFEYRKFVPVDWVESGDRVAAQVEIHLTRRTTGKEVVMHTADFWTVENGKVVKMVEYYDTALANSVL
jgi:ketosteroid isomerase-like protein